MPRARARCTYCAYGIHGLRECSGTHRTSVLSSREKTSEIFTFRALKYADKHDRPTEYTSGNPLYPHSRSCGGTDSYTNARTLLAGRRKNKIKPRKKREIVDFHFPIRFSIRNGKRVVKTRYDCLAIRKKKRIKSGKNVRHDIG